MDKRFYEEMEARIPHGTVRTRFAPSPTGYMHIGNLRTALYTYLIARQAGGSFVLRIEDTDKRREVEGAVDIIYNTLCECGLTVDEGPGEGGPVGPYTQSERRSIYAYYAELLIGLNHAYYCFCGRDDDAGMSEEDIDASHAHTPCACRTMDPALAKARAASGEPYVIRQRIPREGTTTFHDAIYGEITVPNDSLDDQVLLKSDGLPTYNFANVIDDHLMGITHVVRGSEYLASAPKYDLLYGAYGWEVPTYVHCPPVMRDASHKMSKRHGDPSYEDLRREGFLTEAILNYVALLGWSPRGDMAEREFFTLAELIRAFDMSAVSRSPAIFDIDKLKYFNAAYIRAMSDEEFWNVARPYILRAVHRPDVDTVRLAALLKPRTEVLTDIAPQIDFIDELPDYDISLFTHKKSRTDAAGSLRTLTALRPILAQEPESGWDAVSLGEILIRFALDNGVKNAYVMWPLRIAVSGRAVTPGGGAELAAILGKEETLRRIDIAIHKLGA